MTRYEPSLAAAHTVDASDHSVADAVQAGVIMQTVDDVEYRGRYVQIGGEQLRNFGSCSYLGLEQRPELKRGAIAATERFGTQFSYSRAYLQLPLYTEIEEVVSRMTGGHALIAPTTTLGHLAALPVMIERGDAVLIDQFAHASLHMAAAILRSPRHFVRHGRTDLLEQKVARLSKQHDKVWLIVDGLYSMLGDLAPLERLGELLRAYPKLHLYVDDAHATSWLGKHGRGHALSHVSDPSRVVVALGFAKAFGVGGAALVFGNRDDMDKVRRCGGPMLFSGPLQPPVLGAALASANLHVSTALPPLQQALMQRIDRVLALGEALGVPFASYDRTPIFFVKFGEASAALEAVTNLRRRGIYTCVSVFPAVPLNHAGVRFTVSVPNEMEDVEQLMLALADEVQRAGLLKTPMLY